LTSAEVQGVTTSVTYENLLTYLNKNIPIGKIIINQALAAQRGREAAKAARQLVIRKSALEVSELPGKLADVTRGTRWSRPCCFCRGRQRRERQGRDRRYTPSCPAR
jgi:DNA gyrase subunit B